LIVISLAVDGLASYERSLCKGQIEIDILQLKLKLICYFYKLRYMNISDIDLSVRYLMKVTVQPLEPVEGAHSASTGSADEGE